MPAPALDPQIVWGAAVRAIAAVYIVAFWSLDREVLALCGSRGITPIAGRLARVRRDMGSAGVAQFPSLLWISSSDAALTWLPRAGLLAAALVLGGIASRAMIAAAWIIYLSLDVAFGLTYPWESLLLEAGFLAILLPPLERLPSVRMSAAPDPLLMWMFQWLLFRVLFGFGKNKFKKAALRDPLYLRSFLISQPILSPLGWRAWRLPSPILRASHALLFVVEMILPFFVFVAGWPRLVAAAGFTGLMIAIQAMGNFGFFNMLVIALSITLLDPRPLTLVSIRATAASSDWPIVLVACWVAVAGLFHLPFNTWVARGWLEWPAWGALPRAWRGIFAVLRAAMPWRTVHAYGVFPPCIGPPVKWIPVIEGTMDGERWEVFRYRYMPSAPESRPPFVAPHTPRLDHFALYDGMGVGHTNLVATLVSRGSPYEFAFADAVDRLLQRLLEPDSAEVRGLFANDPFDGRPPRMVRARLFAMTPTTPEDLARTGRYWHMDFVSEHARPRGSDPALWERGIASPEQFHPDERWARRRVKRLAPILHATSLDAVRDALDHETAARWDEFWTVLIPAARAACDAGWPAVDRLGRECLSRHGAARMHEVDRIRGAVATALLERLEPRVLRRAGPPLEPRSYFDVSIWANALLAGDPAIVCSVLRDPSRVSAEEVNGADTERRGLMIMTVFRYDLMTLHARKHRVLTSLHLPDDPLSPVVPGFRLAMPALGDGLRDPDECLPALAMTATGDWTFNGTLVTDRRLSR